MKTNTYADPLGMQCSQHIIKKCSGKPQQHHTSVYKHPPDALKRKKRMAAHPATTMVMSTKPLVTPIACSWFVPVFPLKLPYFLRSRLNNGLEAFLCDLGPLTQVTQLYHICF